MMQGNRLLERVVLIQLKIVNLTLSLSLNGICWDVRNQGSQEGHGLKVLARSETAKTDNCHDHVSQRPDSQY